MSLYKKYERKYSVADGTYDYDNERFYKEGTDL